MKLGQNLKSNISIKTGKKIGLPNFKTIKIHGILDFSI